MQKAAGLACFLLLVAGQSDLTRGVDLPPSQSERDDVRVVKTTSTSTGVDLPPFQSKRDDVRVVKTTSTSTGVDRSQDAPSPDGSRVAPLAGDHDLIQGVCADDNYNLFKSESVFAPADPNNRTTTLGVRVTFLGPHDKIVCIKMLDDYTNGEGEDLGGYPSVTEGGVGYDFVQMLFTSQPGQDLFFTYEVYAFEPETSTDATSTTAKGGAEAVGIARGNWLVLSAIVLVSKCVFMGN